MGTSWREDLLLGLKEIDVQHREYFRRTDQLIEVCLSATGPVAFDSTLAFLKAYVHFHFSHEEKLMEAKAYPETAFHKTQHRWFAKEIESLAAAGKDGKPLPEVLRLNTLLVDWFQNHIKVVDRKLVTFLLKTTQSGAE